MQKTIKVAKVIIHENYGELLLFFLIELMISQSKVMILDTMHLTLTN